ncbi:MAG: response regulator transcription factor [Dehalococcoidia bacterium]|nr:MAG: response regulator transcription factor [Dehalococcoidia bacterium]
MHILVAEDDQRLARVIERVLTEEGHRVDLAFDGEDALALGSEGTFDVAVLDVMMPGLDGFEVLAELRRRGVGTPVLLLTARGEVEDRVRGLDLGADDYLTKPFAFAELLARIRARGRRQEPPLPAVLTAANISLDVDRREVYRDGEAVPLGPTEFRLLEYLMRHPGQTLSRASILAAVWGYTDEPVESTVDLYIHYLRQKLGRGVVTTVRGVGFRLGGT